MRRVALAVLFVAAFLLGELTPAEARPSRMKVPRPAPEWIISEWINGPGTTLQALRGQVVVIDFFQLWCPGCNSFSILLMHHWEEVFADEIKAGRIKFVSIHTVFEGHDYQNPDKLKRFLKRKKINHLVGVDRHAPGQRVPRTMRLYGTMGTPEMAFIGPKGMVRFQEFGGFDVRPAEELLRQLLAEAEATARPAALAK